MREQGHEGPEGGPRRRQTENEDPGGENPDTPKPTSQLDEPAVLLRSECKVSGNIYQLVPTPSGRLSDQGGQRAAEAVSVWERLAVDIGRSGDLL